MTERAADDDRIREEEAAAAAEARAIGGVAGDEDEFEDALTQVWNAIAAAGADDELAFAEHPDLPEHWRERAAGS